MPYANNEITESIFVEIPSLLISFILCIPVLLGNIPKHAFSKASPAPASRNGAEVWPIANGATPVRPNLLICRSLSS